MKDFLIIAGPCAVESEKHILKTAEFLKKLGIKYLRGGTYKHRTSPDAFQGLGDEAISLMEKAKQETGLKLVSEILDPRKIDQFKNIDIIQIGARNAQNFPLIIEAAKTKKTILLKRGFGNTIDEWLKAADYIKKQGNNDIIMCARGIRTFETETRNSPDIDAIPIVKQKGFKVIFDPSHCSGKKELVLPLAKAAIAAGADGLIVEVHPDPKKALSDSAQQLTFEEFENFLKEIQPYINLR